MILSEFAKKCGVSRQAVSQWKADGMPVESEELAAEWVVARDPKYASKLYDVSAIGSSAAPKDGADLKGLDLDATLERFRRLEFMAWQALEDAVEERKRIAGSTKSGAVIDAAIGRASKRYKDAAVDRMAIEQKVFEFGLETGRLVSMAHVQELINDQFAGIAVMVKALPFQLGADCNPHDPETAKVELDRWSKNFLRQMRGEVVADD